MATFLANNLYCPAADPSAAAVPVGPVPGVRQLPAVQCREQPAPHHRCPGGGSGAAGPRGHSDVPVRPCRGNLTDHYDPRDNTIYLSETVYDAPTIAAVGVAAHEAGHAVQYAENYGPVRLRTRHHPRHADRLPACPSSCCSSGLLLYSQSLFFIGIVLFSFTTLFQLVTLPVEFNASRPGHRHHRRGRACWMRMSCPGAKKVLRAAAHDLCGGAADEPAAAAAVRADLHRPRRRAITGEAAR